MKSFLLFLLMGLCVPAWGQSSGAATNTAANLKQAAAAPSGACAPRGAVRINQSTIYVCPQSGTAIWTAVSGGGGGGGGTITLTGDATGSGTTVIATTISGLALSKLAALTANRALLANASGVIAASATTDTELGYLSGVTSGVQAQLDAKAAAAHTHALSALTQSGATTNQVPQWNGTAWVPATVSGGGSPGGATTQLQYNNAGALGGISGATSDGTNATFGAGNLRATSPRLTTSILDSNGNTLIGVTATASAVNYLQIANGAAGSGSSISATGSDASQVITINGKGTSGGVYIGTDTSPSIIQIAQNLGVRVANSAAISDVSNAAYNIGTTQASVFSMASNGNIAWSDSSNAPWASKGLTLGRAAAAVLRIADGATSGAATLSSVARTPAQITADQNNYAPGVGWFQRWTSDASRTVTGLAAGVDGQKIEIWNVGSQNIVLANQSASSTAANRFLTSTGADITIGANQCVAGQYDLTTARWRVWPCAIGAAGSSSFAADVGDGSSTSITITHNLGTRDVHITLYRNSAPYDTVTASVSRATINTTTFTFPSAPTSAEYRAVISK